MRELQYRDIETKPKGYSNIEYNTEYAGLGGLNFGITKIMKRMFLISLKKEHHMK